MPPDAVEQTHPCAAQGYIELGMFDAANAELKEIDPLCRHQPEVLTAVSPSQASNESKSRERAPA
jgi:hypothetical protein